VHQRADLTDCLREVHRVLKPGGYFLILNETPFSSAENKLAAANMWLITRRVLRRRWEPTSVSVSAGGIVYDPYLGDALIAIGNGKPPLICRISFQSVTTPYFSTEPRKIRHTNSRTSSHAKPTHDSQSNA
jgi:hypothetical protein